MEAYSCSLCEMESLVRGAESYGKDWFRSADFLFQWWPDETTPHLLTKGGDPGMLDHFFQGAPAALKKNYVHFTSVQDRSSIRNTAEFLRLLYGSLSKLSTSAAEWQAMGMAGCFEHMQLAKPSEYRGAPP